MSFLFAWLLFPLVLGAISLGCGLLVERISGLRLQRELLLPLGFATIVVIALFTTMNSTTARLTTPLVVALAVAGVALALPWRPWRADGWAAAAATAVYVVFGAPMLFAGSATLAGYIKLDDTSTWLALADRLLTHGRNVTGLAPSSYEAAVSINLAVGYPVGAFPPLGIAHELLGTDSAWLFQPYEAFLAAMLALGVYGLLAGVIESRPLRAVAAFIAAQPALLYAYSLWGGVKEIAAAAILVVLAALIPPVLEQGARVRSVLPLAMATAALLGVESFFGAVWIAPMLIGALVAGLWLRRLAFVPITAAFAVLAAVLSVPTLSLVGDFSSSGSTLTTSSELGNLLQPLSNLQVAGIWPVGDFRTRPSDIDLTYALVAIVAVAALAGLYWAWRRRQWALVLYIAGIAAGCAVIVAVSSPWVDAKALATASPATLVAAMAALGWFSRSGRRTEVVVAVLVIGGGVAWSNALAYHDVSLAPRSQLHELETIGNQFSGSGPALMTEYSPYGVRHFLRKLDPEGASELRRRPILLRDGGEVAKGEYADIDRFSLGAVLVYRTLVLMHTPSASRPPSVYHRVWSGSYYDVWQRSEPSTTRILEHLPLGNDLQPASVPVCSDVLRLGGVAAAGNGRLVAAVRPAVKVVDLASAALPAGWLPSADSPGGVYPSAAGTLRTTVRVPADGRYGFSLAGSFRRALELSIDGREVSSAQNHLNHPGVDTPLGEIALAAGRHQIALRMSAADLSPGSGGPSLALGPLLVSRSTSGPSLVSLPPGRARSLCGRRLDWIEAVTS
jgi:hypothetical protein